MARAKQQPREYGIRKLETGPARRPKPNEIESASDDDPNVRQTPRTKRTRAAMSGHNTRGAVLFPQLEVEEEREAAASPAKDQDEADVYEDEDQQQRQPKRRRGTAPVPKDSPKSPARSERRDVRSVMSKMRAAVANAKQPAATSTRATRGRKKRTQEEENEQASSPPEAPASGRRRTRAKEPPQVRSSNRIRGRPPEIEPDAESHGESGEGENSEDASAGENGERGHDEEAMGDASEEGFQDKGGGESDFVPEDEAEAGAEARERTRPNGTHADKEAEGGEAAEDDDDDTRTVALSTATVRAIVHLMHSAGWAGKRTWKVAFRWLRADPEYGPTPVTPQGRELWTLLCDLAALYASKAVIRRPEYPFHRRFPMAEQNADLAARRGEQLDALHDQIRQHISLVCDEVLSPLAAPATADARRLRTLLADDLAAFVIPQAAALLEAACLLGGSDRDEELDMDGFDVPLATVQLTRHSLELVKRAASWLARLEAALAHELGYRREGKEEAEEEAEEAEAENGKKGDDRGDDNPRGRGSASASSNNSNVVRLSPAEPATRSDARRRLLGVVNRAQDDICRAAIGLASSAARKQARFQQRVAALRQLTELEEAEERAAARKQQREAKRAQQQAAKREQQQRQAERERHEREVLQRRQQAAAAAAGPSATAAINSSTVVTVVEAEVVQTEEEAVEDLEAVKAVVVQTKKLLAAYPNLEDVLPRDQDEDEDEDEDDLVLNVAPAQPVTPPRLSREPVRRGQGEGEEGSGDSQPLMTPAVKGPVTLPVVAQSIESGEEDGSSSGSSSKGMEEPEPLAEAALQLPTNGEARRGAEASSSSSSSPSATPTRPAALQQPPPQPKAYRKDELQHILRVLKQRPAGGNEPDLARLARDLGRDVLDVASRAESLKNATRTLALRRHEAVPRWAQAGYRLSAQ